MQLRMSSSTFLKISTIHGLLDDFLKEQGSIIHLKSDFGYLSQSETQFYSKKILKEIIEEKVFPDLAVYDAFSFSQIHQLLVKANENDLLQFSPVDEKKLVGWLEEILVNLQKKCQEQLSSIRSSQLPEKWVPIRSCVEKIQPLLNLKNWADSAQALSLIEPLDLRGLKIKSFPDSALIYDSFKEFVVLRGCDSE